MTTNDLFTSAVERIDSVSATPPSDAKMATTFNENILSTIGAYGLAIQAMGGRAAGIGVGGTGAIER